MLATTPIWMLQGPWTLTVRPRYFFKADVESRPTYKASSFAGHILGCGGIGGLGIQKVLGHKTSHPKDPRTQMKGV